MGPRIETIDTKLIGDFQAYYWESASRRKFGEQTQSDTHEVWIPIALRKQSSER